MRSARLVLLVAALLAFVVAVLELDVSVPLVPLGLACWVAAELLAFEQR